MPSCIRRRLPVFIEKTWTKVEAMDALQFPVQTVLAERLLQRRDARIDRAREALLRTVDGQRNVVELESVARALGLQPSALDQLRQSGLIQFDAVEPDVCGAER
jgi:hypothetical protein